MAAFISDGNLEHMTYKGGENEGELYSWWKTEYNQIPELVANGDVQWITVLAWSLSYTYASPVTPEHATQWAEAYPSDKVPVLADSDAALSTYINRTGTPILILLDENFEFLTHFGPQVTGSAFTALLAEDGPLH